MSSFKCLVSVVRAFLFLATCNDFGLIILLKVPVNKSVIFPSDTKNRVFIHSQALNIVQVVCLLRIGPYHELNPDQI